MLNGAPLAHDALDAIALSAHPIKLTIYSNTTIMEVHIHRKQVWLAQKFVVIKYSLRRYL
jgi:hypothetical protein